MSIALNCILNDGNKMGKSNKTQVQGVHLVSTFSEARNWSTILFFTPKCAGIQRKSCQVEERIFLQMTLTLEI